MIVLGHGSAEGPFSGLIVRQSSEKHRNLSANVVDIF